MEKNQKKLFDAVEKSLKEIAGMQDELKGKQSAVFQEKAKRLVKITQFLEKQISQKPEITIKNVTTALAACEQANKDAYASIQKQFDKEHFDAMPLNNLEIKIYKYILKSGKSI